MTLDTGRSKRGQMIGVAAFVATVLSCGGTAGAQANAADEQKLETVVVTANKRAENAQRVPIAITAVTADDAGKLGVVNGQTLAQIIPGLQLNRQTNGTTPFLRGVGNPSNQAGTEPAVAMYVDDVYYGSTSVALTNYNSIQRIEVLKGPQGTLFGRNATGGVIQVFTRDPSDEAQTQLSLGYANYDTPSGSFYTTGKLSDNVAANLAVYGEKSSGGWGRNFTTGNPTYRSENFGGRIKVRWNLGESTTAMFNADYDDYKNQQAVYFRPAPGTRSNAGALSDPPAGRFDTFENIDPKADVAQHGASLKLTHDFSANRLVSITAYRKAEATQLFAQDGSKTFRLNPLLVYNDETYTQELQLLSGEDSRINWVTGAFFLKNEVTVEPFVFNGLFAGGGLNGKGAYSTQKTDSYSAFVQASIPVGEKANITAGARYTNDDRSLTGGRQNVTATGTPTVKVPATNSGLSRAWSKVTGRLSFDYQFADDFMGYVAVNRGFRSGMFNTIIPPDFVNAVPAASVLDPPVQPETLDAITAGFKSEWANNTVRLNVEAFHYKYDNLQLQKVFSIPGGGTATQLQNAAEATIKGVDIDILWQPTDRFTMNAAFQFMDGEYDDFPNGQFFVYRPVPGGNCAFVIKNAGNCVGALPPNYDATTGTWNLKGNKTIQTPPFSASINGTYTVPLSSGSELDLTLNYSHTGDYYADADNGLGQIAPSTPNNNRQDLINMINASVTWRSADEKWNVRLWGKNLSDEEYWSFANETGTVTKQVPAPPRTYGITFTTTF